LPNVRVTDALEFSGGRKKLSACRPAQSGCAGKIFPTHPLAIPAHASIFLEHLEQSTLAPALPSKSGLTQGNGNGASAAGASSDHVQEDSWQFLATAF